MFSPPSFTKPPHAFPARKPIFHPILLRSLIAVCLLAASGIAKGQIAVTGDFDPVSSVFWTGGGDTGTDGYIGLSGTGTLDIAGAYRLDLGAGMLAANIGSSGTATVTGSEAEWNLSDRLNVGRGGSGELNVQSGGLVSNTLGILGGFATGTGTGWVTGAGSQWNNSSTLSVGGSGTGILTIEAGGVVSSVGANLATSDSGVGTVTVTGAGSQWNNAQNLVLGNNGQGTLIVEAGGIVSNTISQVGSFAGSTGTITVTGSGSQWNNSGNVSLGLGGTGVMTIADEGVVGVNNGLGTITLASFGGGAGTINIGALPSDSAGVAGALNVAQVNGGSGSGAAVLNFNHSDTDYVFTKDGTAGGAGVVVGGTTSVYHLGSGQTTITSTNSYTGGTTVNAGTLVVDDGSISHSSAETVVGEDNGEVGVLRIQGGGSVTNAAGTLGEQSGAIGSALVTGAGSEWSNVNDLFVGKAGSGTLTVADEGVVSVNSGGGTLTLANSSGSTGTLNIGSLPTDAPVIAGVLNLGNVHGATSSGNAVVNFHHTDADYFFTRDGTASGTGVNLTGFSSVFHLGPGQTTLTGTHTYAEGTTVNAGTLVLDSGTITHNGSNLRVGVGNGDQGSFVVKAGGVASTDTGFLGQGVGSTGGVTVTGSSSQWNSGGDLFLGSEGSGTLNVEEGGLVSNSSAVLGFQSGATGSATVTGANSQWNHSQLFYIGNNGTGSLTVEAGGVVSNTEGNVGVQLGAIGSATVSGVDSEWNNSGDLFIGNAGTGTLRVEAGGVVSNDHGTLGNQSSGQGTATVTGTGSQWNQSGDLSVGATGTGNLAVEAGGVVSNTSGTLGGDAGSEGSGVVTGAGSQWNNSGLLSVGNFGTGTLTVANDGVVSINTGSGNLYLGSANGSTGTLNIGAATTAAAVGAGVLNLATIQGGDGSAQLNFNHHDADYFFTRNGTNTGNAINISGSTTLSHFGSGQTTLTGSYTHIGGTTVNGGTLAVDTGSITHNGVNIVVGDLSGDDGALRVQAGGVVSNSFGLVGNESGSTGTVTVTGTDSEWNNANDLLLGNVGSGTLAIQDGGQVTNQRARIGDQAGSAGSATVSGSGSQWTNNDQLTVGVLGEGVLRVEAGGTVSSPLSFLGSNAGSTGTATITGTGSEWNISSGLAVGSSGEGILHVEAGGLVTNTAAQIAISSESTGTVTVTGEGSQWNTSGQLVVGNGGLGTLNMEDGGVVSSLGASIAENNESSGSSVSVSGANAQWNITNALFIGNDGEGSLQVRAGGVVSTAFSALGNGGSAEGTATVTGSGSEFNLSNALVVGSDGTGTLNIEDSGNVTSLNTQVAEFDFSVGGLHLQGGRLTTGQVSKGDGEGSIDFDGGTLRLTGDQAALFDNFQSNDVTLASGGGTLDTQAFTVATSQVFSGAGGLTKRGSGTLALAGDHTFTGAVKIERGTLELSAQGSILSSSSVQINDGAYFDVTDQSDFIMPGSQEFVFELNPLDNGGAGRLMASGLDIETGNVRFALSAPLNDLAYVLADYQTLTGTQFATVQDLPAGYILDYAYNQGTQIAVVVPEPGSLLFLTIGLTLACLLGRRSTGRKARRKGLAV